MKESSLPQQLLLRVTRVPIRAKIMGIVLGSILFLGIGMVWVVRVSLVDTFSRHLEERGVSIARDVAARATDLILTNNSYSLYELLRDTLENNEDVRYVIILDQGGGMLVQTLGRPVPEELVAANAVGPQDRFKLEVLDTEEGLIRDVAVPIFEGRAGVVRVGMSDRGLQVAVATVTEYLLMGTAMASLLGLVAAYLLTAILTRPIRDLVEATRAVAGGNLRHQAHIWGRDEIGQLGDAFNEMTTGLREKEELRAQLLVKVMAAQEEERKRISRELHDETSQSLTSLMVGLKVLEGCGDPVAIASMATELRSLTARTIEAVHDLARELRPSALDDLGLVAAVERHVREYARRHGYELDFQASGLEGLRLPAPTELAIYRIIQEALTNTAKYAGASAVSVTLRRRDALVVAIVEDDGKGFDVKSLLQSGPSDRKLGLFGMQERAALVGGKLTVESAPGAGTTVFVEAPLEEEGSIA